MLPSCVDVDKYLTVQEQSDFQLLKVCVCVCVCVCVFVLARMRGCIEDKYRGTCPARCRSYATSSSTRCVVRETSMCKTR